jgi:hypothetical protein
MFSVNPESGLFESAEFTVGQNQHLGLLMQQDLSDRSYVNLWLAISAVNECVTDKKQFGIQIEHCKGDWSGNIDSYQFPLTYDQNSVTAFNDFLNQINHFDMPGAFDYVVEIPGVFMITLNSLANDRGWLRFNSIDFGFKLAILHIQYVGGV